MKCVVCRTIWVYHARGNEPQNHTGLRQLEDWQLCDNRAGTVDRPRRHGWTDQNVLPRPTVDYYSRVLEMMGARKRRSNWLRLFMFRDAALRRWRRSGYV